MKERQCLHLGLGVSFWAYVVIMGIDIGMSIDMRRGYISAFLLFFVWENTSLLPLRDFLV
jgi:hypothetical protein